jgi:presenilin-like A22 family membrane protease
MNKVEFYSEVTARDREFKRQENWYLIALFGWMFLPIGLMVFLPDCFTPLPSIAGRILLAVEIGGLIGLLYLQRYFRARTSRRLGLTCPECGVAFEGQLLMALGFCESCGKCGARIFDGPNSSSSGRGEARRSTSR